MSKIENVLLAAPDGGENLQVALGAEDEFERTRKNKELMRLLDERRAEQGET